MNRSITLKVTLKTDEIADFIAALETVAWFAGDCALKEELHDVGQLDWLIGEFKGPAQMS